MNFLKIYKKFLEHFGTQGWWPAESKFEIILGAILTQQTTWKNVEKVIENLKNKNLLDPSKLANAKLGEIEKLIRQTGFYKQKARRLRDFSKYLVERYNGDLGKLFSKPLNELRKELLNLSGIGYETADSILLYAGNKRIFVIDAYTKRLCERLGIKRKGYEKLRIFFEKNLPRNIGIYKEFHALIVQLGKNYCKIKPVCNKCPLNAVCTFCKEFKSNS